MQNVDWRREVEESGEKTLKAYKRIFCRHGLGWAEFNFNRVQVRKSSLIQRGDMAK